MFERIRARQRAKRTKRAERIRRLVQFAMDNRWELIAEEQISRWDKMNGRPKKRRTA